MTDALREEIDRNFDFFQRSLSRFLPQHEGRYALLRHQREVDFFDEPDAADRAGLTYGDGLYSIQRVVSEPVDLGLFSDAAH